MKTSGGENSSPWHAKKIHCQKNKYNFRMKNNHLSCFTFCFSLASFFLFLPVLMAVCAYHAIFPALFPPENSRINDVSWTLVHIANQIKLRAFSSPSHNRKFELMVAIFWSFKSKAWKFGRVFWENLEKIVEPLGIFLGFCWIFH